MASFLDPSTVVRTVLPNGLTVLIRRDTSAPVVAVVTHVKAGYFDETDDVNGIAHVLEHMFFKGTERRGVGEIAKETKASGGYLNAHTIYDATVYYTVLPSSGFAAGLDIQADAFANSVIDSGELKKELEVIIQEAKRKADSPPALAVETLYELIHDRHRMRRWRIGHEDGLRRLDRAAMLRFYRNFYRPSNTILTVVGDVDPDDAMRRIESSYGSLTDLEPERSHGPAEPHHDELRYRELDGDIAQSQLVMGWRTPRTMHEDTPALDVAAQILGAGRASRLYRALRERQLVSSVSSYNYTPTELGVFVVHAETRAEKVVDAARAVWQEIESLRDKPIEQLELDRVRSIFEARWMRRFESMEGQANYLAEWEALGDWQMGDEYFSRFMSVTGHEVHSVATRYLDPRSAGIVVYRPASAPPTSTGADDFVRLIESDTADALEPLPPRDRPQSAREAHVPKFIREESGVFVYETSDGTPILVRPKAGAAFVHVGVHATGGVRDEPAEHAGITTIAMRSSVKGTSRRTAAQIAEDSEILGGSIGTSVGSESFGWSMSVPAQHMEAALELLSDVIHDASIPEEAIDVERTVALADLAALRDDMFRFPMRLVMSSAFEGHPYAMSPLGTEESLRRLTVEDVRQWYRGRLLTSRFAIGIVGDVEPSDAAGVAARELGMLRAIAGRAVAAPVWPEGGRSRVESRTKAQTALALAFRGPTRKDPRRLAAQLTATIASGLGGRFFDELRDRQSLAYTVHAYTSEQELAGMFLSYIATSPEKEEVAREGLLREFARLREEPVTPDELDRAKRYTIGSHAINKESGAALLGEMLDAFLLGTGLREIDEHDRLIEAVTAADILALARESFVESTRVEGVVRGVGKTV
jgi:zinc protease